MPFVKFAPSNDPLCRRKSIGTMCSSSPVMILTASCFLDTTSVLLASLRDADRDLVWRGSNTGMLFLERFGCRATAACELFSLFRAPFFVVAFLSPASFLVALEDARAAAGLDVSTSSFSLAVLLRPRSRLGLVLAAVLVDVAAFFFFGFVSFGTAASSASVSPVTLATSPYELMDQ